MVWLKGIYSFVASRPVFRVALQAAVSLLLIAMLMSIVQQGNLVASLQQLNLTALMLAATLQLTGFILNSYRWQLLLANVQVRERLGRLASLYFIGLFCSLFLPTSAGGDAVRVIEVSRSSGSPAATIMATLQERLIGLGGSLLIGLVATLYYMPYLPTELRVWVLIVQLGGAAGVGVLIYPALLFRLGASIWQRLGHRPLLQRAATHPLGVRLSAALHPIATLPALRPVSLALVLGVAVTAILLGIGVYYVLGLALQLPVNLMMFCLVVPLVWIVRMLPLSLNGVGLGEGAFVFMLSLFAIPASGALALALAVLALQVCLSLIGGVIVLLRVVRGTWVGMTNPAVD